MVYQPANGRTYIHGGITNYRHHAYGAQSPAVETGFVIVTQDCEGGMVDIHDPRAVVLEPAALGAEWIRKPRLRKRARIARSRSLPSGEFQWWKVSWVVNAPDPNKNSRELLAPIGY